MFLTNTDHSSLHVLFSILRSFPLPFARNSPLFHFRDRHCPRYLLHALIVSVLPLMSCSHTLLTAFSSWPPISSHGYSFNFLKMFICRCNMYMHMYVSKDTCGHQRAACRNQFSSSTIWVLELDSGFKA